jgi:hypothetical protein
MFLETEHLMVESHQDSPPSIHNSAVSQSWIKTDVGAFHAYLHGDVHTDVNAAVAANASVFGEWDDTIKILSDTFPNGTPVDLTATVKVDRLVNVPAGQSWFLSIHSPWVDFNDSSSQRNLSNTATGIIHTFVGSTVGLWQTINANLQPQVLTPGSAVGTVDFSHTSSFLLDAPAGVTIQSEGKYSYAPAAQGVVPEPGMLAIWSLLGLTFAGGSHWRKNRSAK